MHLTSVALLCQLVLPWLAPAQGYDLRELGRREYFRTRANSGSSTIIDSSDFDYKINITLGGQSFSVQIDTGSSDLWVAADDTSAFEYTSATAEVTYAVGSVSGPVATAELQLAGFTVDNQAFIAATPSTDNPSGTGLLGLGPFEGSQVFSALGEDAATGNPPLDRIFSQDTSTANYITFKLGRDDDTDHTANGNFTIGEPISQYSNITSQTKLNVTALSSSQKGNQHWQVLLDANGVTVGGQTVQTTSSVSSTLGNPTNQLAVVFDTGFTFPQVPKFLSDAIYSNVSGAQFQNVSGVGEVWVLPCDAVIDLSFVFGGQTIPIHPLDTNLEDGNTCMGSFQPLTSGAESSTYDAIFGMAFLRNVYLLVDFGDFADVSDATTKGEAYVQMIATTNANNAKVQFKNARSGGPNISGWREVVIIVAAVVIGVLLIFLAVTTIRRRRGRFITTRKKTTYTPVQNPNPWSTQESYAMRPERGSWQY